MSRTPWVPYKIPPIVERENPSDVYALGWDQDLADSCAGDPTQTNPTQFLKWEKVLPSGEKLGDILYWNPNSGENGEWVILSAPSGSVLYALTIQNGTLTWTATQDC
jgi:hypothetical protein